MKVKLLSLFVSIGILSSTAQETEKFTDKFIEVEKSKQSTQYADFGPHFYKDNMVVFASSKKDRDLKRKDRSHNRMAYLEFYKGTIGVDGDIENVEQFTKEKFNMYHESNITFAPDGKTIYFTLNNYIDDNYMENFREARKKRIAEEKEKEKFIKENGGEYKKPPKKKAEDYEIQRILRATIDKNGLASNLVELSISNDYYTVTNPHIANEGRTLYFVADMGEGEGFGGTDIYKISVDSDGTFGAPINLGPNVNTAGNEKFPFVSSNNILFFSSDGRDSKGGLDIFSSEISRLGAYAPAENVGGDINTEADDFAFIVSPEKAVGYFSSTRDGGASLYKFQVKPDPVPPCHETIAGTVMSRTTRIPLANVKLELFKGDQLLETTNSEVGGAYQFSKQIHCDSTYNIVAQADNYVPAYKDVTAESMDKKELYVEIQMDEVKQFVTIRNIKMVKTQPIHFDLNSSKIRSDAADELDKVVRILQKSPNIKLEIAAHTDSRANDAYNMKLSEARAKSTIQYIIDSGIDPSRVYGKGYGETQLVNECSNGVRCTEDQHQLNRRTEFIIINE